MSTTIILNSGSRVVVRHSGPPGAAGVAGEDGEVTSDTNVSAEDEVVLFKGITGKRIKRSNVLLSALATALQLADKVDKVTGKALSKNDFTDLLKAKLDALAEGGFRGTFDDETQLVADVVDPEEGDYAYVVDPVPGQEQRLYIWDEVNGTWRAQPLGSTPSTGAEILAALIAVPGVNILSDPEYDMVLQSVSQATLDSVILTLTGGSAPTTNVVVDSTTARTPTPSDAGKFIVLTNGGSCTITIQDDATAVWTQFPPITFHVAGGVPVVDPDPGVTVSDPAGILGALVTGDTFTLKKIGADSWVVVLGG